MGFVHFFIILNALLLLKIALKGFSPVQSQNFEQSN